MKAIFTPARLFVGLVAIVLLIFAVTWISKSCQKPALILPKRLPVVIVPTDTTTPKPTPQATAARTTMRSLTRRYPLPRPKQTAIVLPPLPTSGSPTAVLQQQVVILKAEVSRLRGLLAESDTVLSLTRIESTIALTDADSRIQVLTDTLKARALRFDEVRRTDALTVKAYAKALQRSRELVVEEALTDRFLGVGRKRAIKRIVVQMPVVPGE